MKIFILVTFLTFVLAVSSFGGSEDKFIKKYAMMKIYESCFGQEVVKQIRREMKLACAKCASLDGGPPAPPLVPRPSQQAPNAQQPQTDGTPDVENALYGAQQPNFDAEKLHQAILAYRPNPYQQTQQPQFRPYPGASAGAFYNPSFMNPAAYQASPMFYPGFANQYSPFGFPLLGQQYYGNNRMSRDMDIKSQLEALTSRMSGRVRNVTCVMQELGYLDDNLEPNYQKISERIGNLPVSEELRRDMQDGVTFCQQFSQCVPEVKKDKSPLSRELIRPMFFFKCYKHKKLEACIMKDVREKYSGISDDEFDGEAELRRTGKSAKIPSDAEAEIDDLATSMYDFLYGSEGGYDIDGLM